MIDLKELREKPEVYRRGAALKNVRVDIDAILALDERRRAAQFEFEQLRAEQNKASGEIGKLKDAAARKAAIERMGELKARVKDADARAREVEAQLRPLLMTIPQPPDEDVPIGEDAADNVVLRVEGTPRSFDFEPLSHIELAAKHRLVDFERGVRLAGTRSYFLVGAGALMQQAALQMAMDMMTREKGFTPLTVPVLVREEAMQGTGFFPAGREQTYQVDAGPDEHFLTGTAEVGLTGFHSGELLDEKDLPRKYTAVSTCFRREAGTYGKDTAGLYRVHQFDKCEQVVICRNDVQESRRWHMEMLGYGEEMLRRLELPYRVIDWHAPMYYVPRDCPRACFWCGPDTADDDRRWMGDAGARMVIAIESAWLERVRTTVLYRYTMPPETFVPADEDGGHWVSRATVVPLAIEPMTDLLASLAAAGVELRIMPSLIALWQRVVASTLCFSGTRLRNARGWDPALFERGAG